MRTSAVVDTGSLIILHQIRLLSLLRNLYGRLFIPEAVRDELAKGPSGQAILASGLVEVRPVSDRGAVEILRAFLDGGEAEAIQLARELQATIIIDERRGRRIAKSLGLKVRGTLGILLELKRKGSIDSVKPFIDRMFERGYYLSEELVTTVLRIAGEI